MSSASMGSIWLGICVGTSGTRAVERWIGVLPPSDASLRLITSLNPVFIRSIIGMSDPESDGLLGFLFRHIEQPRFHCRYHRNVGDIAIWDEPATVHQGEGAFWPEKRLLHQVCAGHDQSTPANTILLEEGPHEPVLGPRA